MQQFDVHDWYNKMKEGNIILAYKGSISADLITNVLGTVEARLANINEDSKIRKKVYTVMVEALQNLYHHIEEPPECEEELEAKFAIFIFSKVSAGQYKISTGNFVKNEKIQLLKDRMDQINYLSPDELKVLYKLILNNEEFSDKGGGGLGMIDIARKTGNKLEYKFHTYNSDYHFFCLDVIIN